MQRLARGTLTGQEESSARKREKSDDPNEPIFGQSAKITATLLLLGQRKFQSLLASQYGHPNPVG